MSRARRRRGGPVRELIESEVHPDPLEQLRAWLADAAAAGNPEPHTMALATAAGDARPSARVVLLRGLDARGLVFFTNFESRKGLELTANPRAALLFYWPETARQVRVEGRVARLAAAESDAYFDARPVGHRVSAIASPQSRVVRDRAELERLVREVVEGSRRAHRRVARPEYWGGYRVFPEVVEFWQSRSNRLHDRLRYRLAAAGGWTVERLAP